MDTMLANEKFGVSGGSAAALPISDNTIVCTENGYGTRSTDRPSSASRYCFDQLSHDTTYLVPISRFEKIAQAADGISVHRVKLLSILLASASPALCGGRPALRPIWATEALHRAYGFVRLMARLEHTTRSNDDQPDWSDFETKIGVELASIFDSLAIVRDQECRVSSSPLRGLARNLVELFGPSAGNITLMTSIDCLALPALQHRAFILMANELIMNALLHAFKGRHSGRLSLELSVSNRGFARLVMTDDGNGLAATMNRRPAQCSVIAYLADILQSELVYRQAVDGGTIAEIDIPL